MGTTTIGHHIILLPKLALSCSVKISAVVIDGAGRGQPGQGPLEPSGAHVVHRPGRQTRPRRCACESRITLTASLRAGQELLHLLLDPGLDDPAGVLVAARAWPWPPPSSGRRSACGGMGGTLGSVCTSSTVGRSAASAVVPGAGDLVGLRATSMAPQPEAGAKAA